MKKNIIVMIVAVVSAATRLSALDLSLDLSAEGRLSAASAEPVLGLLEKVRLGQELPGGFYAKLELYHDSWLPAAVGPGFDSLEGRALATLKWYGDWATLGLEGGLGRTVSGAASTPAEGLVEIGVFAEFTLPLVGDLLALEGRLRAATDLSGLGLRLELAPTAYLPLAQPLMVALRASLEASSGGYEGSSGSGLEALTLGPEATMRFGSFIDLGGSLGYRLDISGGSGAEGSAFFARLTGTVALEATK